jgi:AcrR family transcriptional regulator
MIQTLNMAQEVVLGRRGRNRLARHDAYLRAAQRLVAAEGIEALTMQRLADAVDAAVGTVYTYFPSKSALLAQLQRQAIERLTASYREGRITFDKSLARRDISDEAAALARIVAFGRFWVESFDVLPDEALLLQLLMSEVRATIAPDDAVNVLPAALELLGEARACVDGAQAAGALAPGDAMTRTVVLAAAINGVLLTDKLSPWDATLFDGRRLTTVVLDDVLRGWGAQAADLDAANAAVNQFARRASFAPAITDQAEEPK